MATAELLQDQELFGTDGVRGQATSELGNGLINPQTFAGLGYALVEEIRARGHEGDIRIAVGRDRRPSGELLAEAAMCGIQAAGGIVINAGIIPTPGVQRIAHYEDDVAGGVIVTASHNPPKYNGVKETFKAFKPTKEEALAITRRFWRQVDSGLAIPNTLNPSRVEERTDATEAYISAIVEDLRQEFKSETPLAGKLFVVDCANGAAIDISPEVFERLGARVTRFGCDPSGAINDNCGAEHLGGVKEFLANHPEITSDPDFMGAVAHDGDADRGNGIGFFNGEFLEITGSHILEAMAEYPRRPETLEVTAKHSKQLGTIGTIYTNTASVRRIHGKSVAFEYCKTGDTAVTQALMSKQAAGKDWYMGAEDSGHAVDMTKLPSGDGTHSMAHYACWAATVQEATFGEIAHALPLWPMRHLKIPTNGLAVPENIAEHPRVAAAIEAQVRKLGGDARAILRPSGTEPVVRVTVESLNPEGIDDAAQRLGEVAMAVAAA